MTKSRFRCAFSLALIAALLGISLSGFSSGAAARDKDNLLAPPTMARSIYFLFNKMTGRKPDIQQAISLSDAYTKADAKTQQSLMAEQTGRLISEFATIDPNTALIVVRSAVNIKADIVKDVGLHIDLPNSDTPKNAIYFPYAWGGMNIALIPDQLQPFLDIPMNIEETSAASSKIDSSRATMVLEMQPLSADGRSAMKLDGIDQWLLMTKVISVTYYNTRLQEIWSWQDPKFKRAGSSSLQELKK